jgi:soluble lytic murein transglycosylase
VPGKTGARASHPRGLKLLLGVCLAVLALSTAPTFAQETIGATQSAEAVALPPVLGAADAERYRQIFALQEKGKLKAAAKIISELDDRILMGHVLAQKYLHPTAHRSKYKELYPWL